MPLGLGIPSLKNNIVLESNPPKSTMLVGRLGVGVHVYTCIYYMCVWMDVRMYGCTYGWISLYIYIYMYLRVCIYIYIYTSIVFMCLMYNVCMLNIDTYTHLIYRPARTRQSSASRSLRSITRRVPSRT